MENRSISGTGCNFSSHKEAARSIAIELKAIADDEHARRERAEHERIGRYVSSWAFLAKLLRWVGAIGIPVVAYLHGKGQITFALFGGS